MILTLAAAMLSLEAVPRPVNVLVLCDFVNSREPEPDRWEQYRYQSLLHDAAGVNLEADSRATIRTKMQRYWSSASEKFLCNSVGFTVNNGSIAKYAASSGFDSFLYDVLVNWNVDLNRPDESDGRNLLDFLDDEIEHNRGTAIEAKLTNYRDLALKAGMKRSRQP